MIRVELFKYVTMKEFFLMFYTKSYLEEVRSLKKNLIGFFIDTISTYFRVELEQKTSGNNATVLANII
jgi:hypothetical protein